MNIRKLVFNLTISLAGFSDLFNSLLVLCIYLYKSHSIFRVSTWRVFNSKRFPIRLFPLGPAMQMYTCMRVFNILFFLLIFCDFFFHHYMQVKGRRAKHVSNFHLTNHPQSYLSSQLPVRNSKISAASRESLSLEILERSVRSCFVGGWFLSKTIRNNLL